MLEIFRPDSNSFEERMNSIRQRLFELTGITENENYRNTSTRVFGSVLAPDEAVRRIIADVKENKDKALVSYTKAFDNVDLTPGQIRVSSEELSSSASSVPDDFKAALEKAVRNVTLFQQEIINTRSSMDNLQLYRRQLPVDSTGIYIPGGTQGSTPLASSVYMNVIPAVAAGVKDIIVCTPPGPDGNISPYILAAISACGIDTVFKAGGAQAVAAMAYGTETIPSVDIIAGPGNLFVMLAKKEVFGQAGIDLLAGPSEICIIADKSTDPVFAAADLMSQAEHDPLASSILITDNKDLAEKVNNEISEQIKGMSRRDIIESSFNRYGGIVLAESMDEAADIANRIAPEHLEIMTENPSEVFSKIRNAGTVFLGQFTPEACGDYMAGPSHTLPTGGTARFFSGLSAETFLKNSSVINLSEETFSEISADAMILAESEGLQAHRNSLEVRKPK